MSVKGMIKNCYINYSNMRANQQLLKTVRQQISSSEERIPELSRQQKLEIKSYWKQYGIDIPLEWHRLFWAKTRVYRPDFVPEPVFQLIIKPQMNDKRFAGAWGDKCYLDKFIGGGGYRLIQL